MHHHFSCFAMLRPYAVIALAGIFACACAERSLSKAASLYELVSVGGHPLARQCSDEELRASRYELSGNSWIAVDTVFKDCTDSLRPEYTRVRRDSGVFSMHADTICLRIQRPIANSAKHALY
jgi:hypothetical protein